MVSGEGEGEKIVQKLKGEVGELQLAHWYELRSVQPH